MNDETRKALTVYLGEEFRPGLVGFPYDFEGKVYSNRTFLTWADLGAVKEALERAGKWKGAGEFWEYALSIFSEQWTGNYPYYYWDFDSWLFRPTVDGKPHFCQLAADFLKEGL